jgi:hypothetical protein
MPPVKLCFKCLNTEREHATRRRDTGAAMCLSWRSLNHRINRVVHVVSTWKSIVALGRTAFGARPLRRT